MVSTDVAALQTIVRLEARPASAQWEIFGTPEFTGWVPGPTDYVTLVAQLTPVDQQAFVKPASAAAVWIAPESARPWLAAPFRDLLEKRKNTTVDLSTLPQCRAVQTTLTRSGRPVRGLTCHAAGKILVYLTIADNSPS